MRSRHTSPGLYEIRVQGRLEPRWAAWFEGFTLDQASEGTTVIRGTVIDQAALHGLLQSLRDLGLPLVSVTQPQGEPDQNHRLADGTPDEAGPWPPNPAQEDPR